MKIKISKMVNSLTGQVHYQFDNYPKDVAAELKEEVEVSIQLYDFKMLAKHTRDVHELAHLVYDWWIEQEEIRLYELKVDAIILANNTA